MKPPYALDMRNSQVGVTHKPTCFCSSYLAISASFAGGVTHPATDILIPLPRLSLHFMKTIVVSFSVLFFFLPRSLTKEVCHKRLSFLTTTLTPGYFTFLLPCQVKATYPSTKSYKLSSFPFLASQSIFTYNISAVLVLTAFKIQLTTLSGTDSCELKSQRYHVCFIQDCAARELRPHGADVTSWSGAVPS